MTKIEKYKICLEVLAEMGDSSMSVRDAELFITDDLESMIRDASITVTSNDWKYEIRYIDPTHFSMKSCGSLFKDHKPAVYHIGQCLDDIKHEVSDFLQAITKLKGC